MLLHGAGRIFPAIASSVCAYVTDGLEKGSDLINVSQLQEKHPHLGPVNPAVNPGTCSFVFRFPLGWVLCGPLI